MAQRISSRVSQLASELDNADAASADRCARELLELARGLRRTPPAASRNDPVGVVERLLARRSNRLADTAERAAARGVLRLTPAARADVVDRLTPRLNAIIPALLGSDASLDRRAGLAIVEITRRWAFVPQASGIIGRESPEETERALDAIAACAGSLAPGHTPQPAALERGIAAVLDAASHHGTGSERRVLAVALLMLTPAVRAGCFGRPGKTWLSDVPEALQLALRSALRTLEGPLGVARALELTVEPTLRRAAIERIASSADPDDQTALLHRAHVGRRPLRRSVLRSRLDVPARRQLTGPTSRLDASCARALPGWLDVLAISAADRAPPLEPLLAHPDAAARFAAVLHGGSELRLDQSLDMSEPVASAAALRLALPSRADVSTGLIDPNAARLLRRSQHTSVRRLADRLPVEGGLTPIALVAMRQELARHPSRTVARLAERAEAHDTVALTLIARLELADQTLQTLAEVLASDEPRAAASAARALASSKAPRAEELLRQCIEHDDPRVRANAIEAAAARARRWNLAMPALRLDDPHHRPASTSLRAQIVASRTDDQTPDRVQQLLASSDADRRVAGLWLTERSAPELKPIAGPRWAHIAARVAESARRGESVQERRRATRCARRMLAVTTA